MKKKVTAIIDDASRCPFFRFSQLGFMEKVLKNNKVAHRPMCLSPAVSKPGYLRPCSCIFDKTTSKFTITEGCPLESIIDDATLKALLNQLREQEEAKKELLEENPEMLNDEQRFQAIDMEVQK